MDLLNSYCGSIISSYFSVQFSHSVVSGSLWPHELQHARPPCPSPTPGACSNSCPLSLWCHPTISSSVVPFSSCLQSFPASAYPFFSSESALHIGWPKHWSFSFSISPSNEYSVISSSNIFSHSVDFLSILLMVSFSVQKLLSPRSIFD